jgi:hypothetical protein
MTIRFQRILFGLLILLPGASIATFSSGNSTSNPQDTHKTEIWLIESTPQLPPSATPVPTQIVIFPLVKQDGATTGNPQILQVHSTPAEDTDTPTPTITPTFIPPQDNSTNVPIVFGAMAIVVVIVVAWFFVSRNDLRLDKNG